MGGIDLDLQGHMAISNHKTAFNVALVHWQRRANAAIRPKHALVILGFTWKYAISVYVYLFFHSVDGLETHIEGKETPNRWSGCLWENTWSKVLLTVNVRGPIDHGLTRSISWLLMPWPLASPGHQQPWYWLCKIGKSWSFTRRDFNYLWHVSVEEWHTI